jgi:hypothetical protein
MATGAAIMTTSRHRTENDEILPAATNSQGAHQMAGLAALCGYGEVEHLLRVHCDAATCRAAWSRGVPAEGGLWQTRKERA